MIRGERVPERALQCEEKEGYGELRGSTPKKKSTFQR